MFSTKKLKEELQEKARKVAEAVALAEAAFEYRKKAIVDEYEKNEKEIYARRDEELRKATLDLESSQSAIHSELRKTLTQIDNNHQATMGKFEKEWSQQKEDFEREHRTQTEKFERELKAVEDATGFLGVPWEECVQKGYTPPLVPPPFYRVGTLTIQGNQKEYQTPALLPFTGGRNLVIKASGALKKNAVEAIQSILLRLLISVPPSKLRLILIDPVGLGGNLAGFMPLAEYDKELVSHSILLEADHIQKKLADLTAHMGMVHQKYLQNRYPGIEAYNEKAGEVAEPYRLLVALNFPSGFTDQAAQRLRSIAENGPPCGVYTFLTVDTEQALPRGFVLADMERTAEVFEEDGGGYTWIDPDYLGIAFSFDTPPATNFFDSLVDAAGKAAKEAGRKVEMPYGKIAPASHEYWTGDSTEGLSVPIGRAGATQTMPFRVGWGTSHHALMVGKTGSGKSTLLHAIILSLVLKYSPEELELYLIDFKKGVEFKGYATRALPHCRVIAIESEREFGLSCLKSLDTLLANRGELFRKNGVKGFAEYRKKTGSKLPRILLLVDEFQEFFTEGDAISGQATMLLERIARQGRSFGLHMILVSQSLAGSASSLNRSTMDQMGVRIALQCSETDSELILARGNSAARLLARPGEAIYNDNMGTPEGNQPFQVAWLTDKDREGYIDAVDSLARQQIPTSRKPIIFEGDEPARVEENSFLAELLSGSRPVAPARFSQAWLGQPVAIKDPVAARFSSREGRHLLILGRNEEAAVGMLLSALVSLAAFHSPRDATFYLFDHAIPSDAEWAGLTDVFRDAVPHPVHQVNRGNIIDSLRDIAVFIEKKAAEQKSDPSSIYIAGFGFHRVRELREKESRSFLSGKEGGVGPSPSHLFEKILREGPLVGVHVLGWWDAWASLTRTVERGVERDFGIRVGLTMSEGDSNSLLDTRKASGLGLHRAYFLDEEHPADMEKFIPYSPPSREWLIETGRMLRHRYEAEA